ncbi:unnamed protein product [Adineta ricciae]|uniref:Uncharacterized protein n=1 Tax=Adineta ricciae TaxID=249248 RepID=A0A815SZG9_ADIRI|nr:unnamed protein product [Adineta ricciae]CAF1496303.1 unnamed protein product [Adineta ricciae]
MAQEYNNEGRLPIHEASFRNYDAVVERILANLCSKDGNEDNDDGRLRADDGSDERTDRLHQARIQEMLDATTYDYFRLTPILAATVGNARRTIECLINHGAKVTCRDGENRSMAAIAILKQNVELLLYFSQASYANELDIWNTLMTMFTSKNSDESTAAGRILEQLTSPKYIKVAWVHLMNLRPIERTFQVLIQTVNNTHHRNEQLLTSCLIILYNLLSIDTNIRIVFNQSDENARALVKMRKTNDILTLLFSQIVCEFCDDTRAIQAFVHHHLIGDIQILLGNDTMNIPKTQACLYFDILGKIARCKQDFQILIQKSSATKLTILEQAIELLGRFDRRLTTSILHFIRELCLQNEHHQQICADNRQLIAHLLTALNSPYRDVQRSSVDTLQMFVTQSTTSQQIILDQGGAEQLLILLSKATLPKLRISIICTLWSLTLNELPRRQSMAYSIGVMALVEFLNLKVSDQLYVVLDAISELLRRIPTEAENIPVIFGRRHCIPPIVRLLSADSEQRILFKCLFCIQQLCLLPTFRPCRANQTIFQKANGINQLLTLIRRSNKEKLLQAKAITTIAYAVFDHKENKDILTKETVRQLFKRIASLLNASEEIVQVEAGAGLVTFICNDEHHYNLYSEELSLDLEHFRPLLTSENIVIRCNAAFQMIIVIRLINETVAAEWIGRALLILFRVIGDPRVDDEDKLLPTDIIGRLAHIPTGFGIHKHSGVCEAIIASDGLDHLISLLNSSNALLHGSAALTIDCLIRHSPEGQRRLLKQCRVQAPCLDVLRTYICGPSVLRTRIDELYSSIHNKRVQFPPIRPVRQRRSLPTV